MSDSIIELMLNGNWTDAIKEYKQLNLTPAELQGLIEYYDTETLKDLALLGFYARGSK